MSNQISYKQSGIQIYQNPSDGDSYMQPDPFRNLNSPNENIPFPTSIYIKLSPRRVNFQPSVLGNTTHIYSSIMYADIFALSKYFGDWSCAYDIQEGPIHTITVQIPWDTVSNEDFTISTYASETWELIPNQDQKSLLFAGIIINPFFPASYTNNFVVLPDTYKAAVQRAYDNKYAFIAAPSGSNVPSASFIPYAQQTLNYMRFGIEGVPSYTQTLKRSAVIDKRNSNNAFQTVADEEQKTLNANGTLNYIISTKDMINNYAVPQDTVAKFMYPSYAKSITHANYDGNSYGVYAGWLVKPPSFQFITRNKVQVFQEFIWNEWMSGLYYINSPQGDFPTIISPAANPSGVPPPV